MFFSNNYIFSNKFSYKLNLLIVSGHSKKLLTGFTGKNKLNCETKSNLDYITAIYNILYPCQMY